MMNGNLRNDVTKSETLILVSVDPTHPDHKNPITLTDDERYKYTGFKNLEELKIYSAAVGKPYTGTSFEEGYQKLIGIPHTEVANINKARHSKFASSRAQSANDTKPDTMLVKLEREDVFGKISELNRKLVALDAFKINFENSVQSKEYNFLLQIAANSMNTKNYVKFDYHLPIIARGTEFTYNLTIYDISDGINGNIVCRINKIDKRPDKIILSLHFSRTDSYPLKYQFKCFLTVKEV